MKFKLWCNSCNKKVEVSTNQPQAGLIKDSGIVKAAFACPICGGLIKAIPQRKQQIKQ